MNVGIDCGGVLLANFNRLEDKNLQFHQSFLEFPAIDQALESVQKLVSVLGQEHVFLVSRVSEEREAGLREWVQEKGFVNEQGFLPKNLYFCREKQDKAAICRQLEITHFIDNRLGILHYLPFVPHLYLFQPSAKELDTFIGEKPNMEYVAETWPELLEKILGQ